MAKPYNSVHPQGMRETRAGTTRDQPGRNDSRQGFRHGRFPRIDAGRSATGWHIQAFQERYRLSAGCRVFRPPTGGLRLNRVPVAEVIDPIRLSGS